MSAREPGRFSRHVNQRVSKVTGRLDDHKIPLGMIVLAVAAFLAYIAFVSTTGPPFQSRYAIDVQVPADAPPLRKGQAVRIGGKLAGLISDVEPDRDNRGATVTANITKPDFRPIGTDARANVRVHSIVYRTYLEIYPGDTENSPMENGGVITSEKVTSGVDLLEVVQLFDKEARESLRSTLINIGYGVGSRGGQLNTAFEDLNPVSKQLNSTLEAATREPGVLGESIADAALVFDALQGTRSDDPGELLSAASAVIGTVADHRTSLAETLELLRPFEDQLLATTPVLNPVLADLADATEELRPAVAGLTAALPEINRLFSLGDELRDETARIGKVANPVLRSTAPVVHEIFPTVAALNPLLPDVDTVVETVGPYAADITAAGQGLASATSVPFPQGQGTGANAPMGRVITILTCHTNRNPFPGPGQAVADSEEC